MRFRKLIVLALTVAAGVIVMPARATGNALPVTTTADEYDSIPNSTCSLREAITSVNSGAAFGGCPAGATGDTILLAEGQTYQLAATNLITDTNENANRRGDLDIGASVAVMAASGSATIDAAGITDRVLDVITGTLTLERIILTNGAPTNALGGGGLRVNMGQAASLQFVSVISNSVGATGIGGGISNFGTLTITHSLISNNSAGVLGLGFEGGGLYSNGAVTISDSTIVSNTAVTGGGGVWHQAGVLLLSNVTVSGNSVIGDGGGIYNAGGGISLNNVTVTNNTAADNGGGVAGSSMSLSNSIVAGNSDLSTGNAPDCAAVLYSAGYNLVQVVQTTTPACILTGNLTGVMTDQSSLLGPLANNGGPTLTHLPQTGSPVINAGNPNAPDGQSPNCTARDQRRYQRLGSRCDLGAVESDGLSHSLYLPLVLR